MPIEGEKACATRDGIYAYTWDGESQLKSSAGVNYTYDGDGRRVSKSNGKLYWYGSGGEILVETNASGTTTNEYIFFGGKRVALLPAGSTAQFYAEDFLGSSRVVTTNTGTVCYDADFYPQDPCNSTSQGCSNTQQQQQQAQNQVTQTDAQGHVLDGNLHTTTNADGSKTSYQGTPIDVTNKDAKGNVTSTTKGSTVTTQTTDADGNITNTTTTTSTKTYNAKGKLISSREEVTGVAASSELAQNMKTGSLSWSQKTKVGEIVGEVPLPGMGPLGKILSWTDTTVHDLFKPDPPGGIGNWTCAKAGMNCF